MSLRQHDQEGTGAWHGLLPLSLGVSRFMVEAAYEKIQKTGTKDNHDWAC